MSALPHAPVLCPHCFQEFRVAAWRLLPGNEVTCRHCAHTFCLDATQAEHKQAMDSALRAKREFKARRKQLRQGWSRRDKLEEPFSEALDPALADLLESLLKALDDAYAGRSGNGLRAGKSSR